MPPPPASRRPGGGGGGGALNQRGPGAAARWPGGGDGPQMVIMEGGAARYRLDFYVQISNLFNYVNYNTFVGNQLSPFFGDADVRRAGAPHRARDVDRVLDRQPAAGNRQAAGRHTHEGRDAARANAKRPRVECRQAPRPALCPP